MEKIKKFLLRLSADERIKLEKVIEQLISGKISSLDVKKLGGYEDIFRVRVGDKRIIFSRRGRHCYILDIAKRDDSAYRKF